MDLRQLEDCANKGSGVVDEAVEHSRCSIELIHLLEQAIWKGRKSKLSGPLQTFLQINNLGGIGDV